MSYCAAIVDIAKKTETLCAFEFPIGLQTTYKTGGKADGVFFPKNAEEAKRVINELEQSLIPHVFLGAGSNVLVSDKGFSGAVVSTEKMKGITVSGKTLVAESGESLHNVIKSALYSSLGGIEFLSGIPASVGGAVAMNAGCFGKNIGDYVAYVVTPRGVFSQKQCEFEYRNSKLKKSGDFISSVCFNLENVEFDQSEEKINKYLKMRSKKDPKGKTCGSVFKNDGYFAGKIIEQSGLKGYRIGGAFVSDRHANFIIAEKNATSGDIKRLIEFIKYTVKERTGIELSEELEYIGEFNE